MLPTFCKPCRNTGRVRRAAVRIDGDPLCPSCARGESRQPLVTEHLQPEPRLLRRPPMPPKYADWIRQPRSQALPAAPAQQQQTFEPDPIKAEFKRPQRLDWERRALRSTRVIAEVMAAVESEFGLQAGILRSRTNVQRVVQPRHLAIQKLYDEARCSYTVIGSAFGQHHTTVMNAVHVARERLATDRAFAEHARRVDEALARAAQMDQERQTAWSERLARLDPGTSCSFVPGSQRDHAGAQAGAA